MADTEPPHRSGSAEGAGDAPPFRVGNGLDFHRLIDDAARPLMIGGVEIPGGLALKGHSDADVLLHALADAMLGALGLGDIGEFFPDTDSRYKNLDSREIIDFVLKEVKRKNYRVGNVDVTLIGERPKITPHKAAIRGSLAAMLGIAIDQVGCKATTTEKMGALGRSEGLGCLAGVLLLRTSPE
ncbi:MAG: 2-C-methyl-D-erythritol 2,4-cyclodiphosphate synthase [Leptospirales bacterium]|jgi:2-C-methyl-D-erythritol 2,4-cyclodiphosphate synthase